MSEQTKRSSRKRLGRGLSSLISSSIGQEAEETYQPQVQEDLAAGHAPMKLDRPAGGSERTTEIPVDQIAPNPYQPRREFDAKDLKELADSIARDGVLQPLLVSPASDGQLPYVAVAGERRLRAARQAGCETVPAIVRQANPQQMLEWALIENIQRTDLNPIERAVAYQQYMDRFSLTQAQVAERLGQSRADVANHLRILELPDGVQDLLRDGSITFGHAKVLAGVSGPKRQVALAKRVARSGLSVRQLEGIVLADRGEGGVRRKVAEAPAYVRDLEDRLTRAVGTRVSIRQGRAKNTGRVVIEYYSLEDFDRIVAALGVSGEAGE